MRDNMGAIITLQITLCVCVEALASAERELHKLSLLNNVQTLPLTSVSTRL